MYLLVVLMSNEDLLWVQDVVAPGAGPVARNTALHIMTLRQGSDWQQQRTTMMQNVAGRRKDSNRRSFVLVVIQDIVVHGGKRVKKNWRHYVR